MGRSKNNDDCNKNIVAAVMGQSWNMNGWSFLHCRFLNLFRILGVRKLGVALEHTSLKWFSGKKMNIFFYEKYSLGYFWSFWEKERRSRDGWVTWMKITGRPKCTSPNELIQNTKSKANAKESLEIERRQIQAVTNLPHLRWISSSRFSCLGKQFCVGSP